MIAVASQIMWFHSQLIRGFDSLDSRSYFGRKKTCCLQSEPILIAVLYTWPLDVKLPATALGNGEQISKLKWLVRYANLRRGFESQSGLGLAPKTSPAGPLYWR